MEVEGRMDGGEEPGRLRERRGREGKGDGSLRVIIPR
jgi:hypothetical protein